jgi:glycerol-3-phosphate dehydrogenase
VGSASREHTIARGPRGVLHVTGGKLTTYREMASQVVDMLAGPEAAKERTAVVALPGGDQSLENTRREAMEFIDDAAVRERLVLSYGTRWRDVWALGAEDPTLRSRISPAHVVIGAEMVHGVMKEMALTLGDLLIRRTYLAFQTADQARFLAPAVAELVAPLLQWTTRDRETALRGYDDEVSRMFDTGS